MLRIPDSLSWCNNTAVLSLILPTYNESENLPRLLPKIEQVLANTPHELIVVDDDSPDRTWELAQELTKNDEHIHVIRRIGRRGLSSAIMEGFLAAKGEVLAVMDADGQHDIALLPKLYAATQDNAELAIGSRYVEGGGVGEWDERRQYLSRLATRLAKWMCRVPVEDPMSGFFAIRKQTFDAVAEKLNPKGFKMLLDILVCIPEGAVVRELPYAFGIREHGKSKMSWKVQLDFLEYLYDASLGRFIPLLFVKYCIVGTLGVGVHMGAYVLFSSLFRNGSDLTVFNFSVSVLLAVETAILFNFLLNNIWTFSHMRLRGTAAIVGFLKYNAACTFGALANMAVSTFLFSLGLIELLSVAIGAFTGVVWNYTMSRMLTWKE